MSHDALEETVTYDNTSMWEQHPDGGIVCEEHGRDPVRSHCVLCEIAFELADQQ